MPNNYIYLISTLPTLHFSMKPAFTFDNFILYCQRFICDKDIEILKSTSISGEYIYDKNIQPTIKKWQDFDTDLRNELVKIRSSRRHIDFSKYLRQEGYPGPYITHIAINAHRNPSILEAEKMLDQERWHFLDELTFGHYFDLDFLIIYALKLLILERWEKINTAEKEKVLEETLKINS